jgi:hypothetical protein
VRRFEGPVLAEREYRAQEAQRSTVRGHTESGPGPRLGEIVLERLADAGAPSDALAWDSRKRADGNWQVQMQFTVDGRPQLAEWVFDPRRRQVIPADDLARRLCLPQADWPTGRLGGLGTATATVTPIGSRLGGHHGDARAEPDRAVARGVAGAPPAPQHSYRQAEPPRPRESGQGLEPGWGQEPAQAPEPEQGVAPAAASAPAARAPAAHAPPGQDPAAPQPAVAAAAGPVTAPRGADGQPPAEDGEPADAPAPEAPARPGRKNARGRRASVPSWDEIMLGNSRQPD